MESHLEQTSPVPSKSHPCNTCHLSFENGQEQRTHMKGAWHIHNLRRRLESLPPVSFEEFDFQPEKKIKRRNVNKASSSGSSSDGEASVSSEQSASPFECLFCDQSFANNDAGFETNLEHMRSDHGLTIPDPELVEDMQGLVGYLATEVRIWHECLYCGATKLTTNAIQSHMRDKGHCLLNLDREPELLDFWMEKSEGEEEQTQPTTLSETEIRLASGKVVESRHAPPTTKKVPKKQDSAPSQLPDMVPLSQATQSLSLIPQRPEPSARHLAQLRQQAHKVEMSLLGVSAQQRQALVLAEKKAQRSAAVASRTLEWVYARGANLQKHDQLDTKMKMGRQNHKLMPR